MDQTPAPDTRTPLDVDLATPPGEQIPKESLPVSPVVPANASTEVVLPDPLSQEQPLMLTQDVATVAPKNAQPPQAAPEEIPPALPQKPQVASPELSSVPTTYYLPTEEISTSADSAAGADLKNPKSWLASHMIFVPLVILVAIFVVAGFVFLAQKSMNTQEATPAIPTQPIVKKPTPTVIPQSALSPLSLSIISPVSGTVVASGDLPVLGKTLPATLVVFFSKDDQDSVESSPSGEFASRIKLTGGINELSFIAETPDGRQQQEQRRVLFSTDPGAKLATESATTEASASAAGDKQFISGIITGINGPVVTILKKTQEEQYYNFTVDSQTVIKAKGGQKMDIAKLPLGVRVAAVGILKDYNTFTAKLMHVVATALSY